MNLGRVEDHLELAWIELEYAAADFAHRRSAATEGLDLADLEATLVKVAVANLALQIAISTLTSRSRNSWLRRAN